MKLSAMAGWGDNDYIIKPMENGKRILKATEVFSLAKALGIHHHKFMDLYVRRMEEHGIPVPIYDPSNDPFKKP